MPLGRIVTFVDGSTFAGLLNETNLKKFLDSAAVDRHKNGSSTGVNSGGTWCVAALVNYAQPSGAGAIRVVLDAQMDWRDRVLNISLLRNTTAARIPGFTNDHDYTVGNTLAGIGYTGFGTEADGTVHPADSNKIPIDTDFQLYADENDGSLCIQLLDTGAATINCILMIWASPHFDVWIPSDAPTLTTTNGAQLRPEVLNMPQWNSSCRQADSAYRPTGSQSESYPFGPVMDRDMKMPKRFLNRGFTSLVRENDLYESRQRALDGVRIYAMPLLINAVDTVLDNSADWRDRVVRVIGRVSSSDIRPTKASASTHNAATSLNTFHYFSGGQASSGGTGALTVATNIIFWVDSATGYLMCRNNTGSTRYMTAIIEASFQFGPRSISSV